MKKEETLIDDVEFLKKLIMGIGEVAEVTKVPTRQIRYWEEKGYIQSLSDEGKNRRYNYATIKKILLIKELMDEGFTLEAAVSKVEKRIEMVNAALNKIRK